MKSRQIEDALAVAGWTGTYRIETTTDRVHVRWNGRHVEAVDIHSAAAFILADAKERAKQ